MKSTAKVRKMRDHEPRDRKRSAAAKRQTRERAQARRVKRGGRA